ncbi:MBOAT family protein [Vineibacter terrae]|uniref:MBOAT family O-acyltransferase n=1 Tax=Vineibacter terrae TaxID=2586908 RepID=UPI002E37C285|nr:MBOAT family protein [Vineibacter terrae]HEX2886792.1 MBOAT family protein [Vineibacter terrae]
MIFPTLNFLLFYVVVWPTAWLLARARQHVLHKLAIIAASYFFYAFWNWKLAFLLFGSVLLNYAAGRLIDRWRGTAAGLWTVRLAVAANLALLGFFKYYGWFIESLDDLLRSLSMARELPYLEIVLPIGISFFTFQGISYIVDLHRRDLDRSRPLIDVMFFISFFPHLVAGPIVRAASFLPQLETPPNPNRVFVGLGVMLVVWGVFKKAIVANYLAVLLVDPVFLAPSNYGAVDLLFAVYGYAIQIYCDFSAYSDIAIGVAALLGYRFQRNFNQPYRAESLQDFWRRWHMSLSSWLRDYLYIPLGGNRGGAVKTYRNLLLTMVLGGVWHGAAWKFVLWGALHGGVLALERFVYRGHDPAARIGRPLWTRVVSVLVIFHFVCLCWIFFRAEDLARAMELLGGLANWSQPVELLNLFLLALIAFGMAIQFTPDDTLQRLDRLYHRLPTWGVGVACGVALLLIEAVGGDGAAPFIYFQF